MLIGPARAFHQLNFENHLLEYIGERQYWLDMEALLFDASRKKKADDHEEWKEHRLSMRNTESSNTLFGSRSS